MGSVPKQLRGAVWVPQRRLMDGRTGPGNLQRDLAEHSCGSGSHSHEWKPEMSSGREKRAEDRSSKRRKKSRGTP